MIKVIIFDANQVLYDAKPANKYFESNALKFIKKHNPSMLGKAEKLWNETAKEIFVGKFDLRDAQKRFLSKLGISQKHILEYEKMDKKASEKNKLMEPSIPQTLSKLRKSYKLSILSDTSHSSKTVRYVLKNLKINRFFDSVFVYSEVGYKKPAPQAYKIILNYYKIKPNEAAFVGHDHDELEGAMKLGIYTISYNGDKLGDHIAKKFSGIMKLN